MTPVAPEVEAQLAALDAHLRALGSVLVCYSGGVDSAFVLAAAHRALGAQAVGLTAVSDSLAPGELEEAQRIAALVGAEHRVVRSNEIEDPGYRQNGPDRCFYCKSELYRIAEAKRREWGLAHVLNGTNVDDLGDHRPGLDAAREAGARSPLVELGFDKAAVRAGAAALGLPIWNKPAAACLSSRIPYGTSVTPERLARIGALEAAVKGLGFAKVRVRYHVLGEGDGARRVGAPEQALARIELDAADVERAAAPATRDAIVRAGKEHGFLYVTVDLAGYRLGSHNEALLPGERRVALPVLT